MLFEFTPPSGCEMPTAENIHYAMAKCGWSGHVVTEIAPDPREELAAVKDLLYEAAADALMVNGDPRITDQKGTHD